VSDRQLPLSDRDRILPVMKRGETPLEYVRRCAIEVYGMPADADQAGGPKRAVGWKDPPFEERLDKIFNPARVPGEDDE
jgi:hypothetical protein